MTASAITPMWKVVFHRVVAVIPTVLFGTMLIFLLVQVIPGGAAEEAAGTEASAEAIEVLREQMGLHRPLPSNTSGGSAVPCAAISADRSPIIAISRRRSSSACRSRSS